MEYLRRQLSTGHKWQLSSRVMAIEAASNFPPRMRKTINGNMCSGRVEVGMLQWDPRFEVHRKKIIDETFKLLVSSSSWRIWDNKIFYCYLLISLPIRPKPKLILSYALLITIFRCVTIPVPKWRVDALPNWPATVECVWDGPRCIKSCINHEPGTRFLLLKTNLAAILCCRSADNVLNIVWLEWIFIG